MWLGFPSPARCTPLLHAVFLFTGRSMARDVPADEATALHHLAPGVPRTTQGTRFPSAGTLTWPCPHHCTQGPCKPPTEHLVGHSSEHGYTHNSLGTNRKAMNFPVSPLLWAKQPRRPESLQGSTTEWTGDRRTASLCPSLPKHGLPMWLRGKESACHCRRQQVPTMGEEDPLEKGIATHSSILDWRIPWTEEPGGLQSMGSQRVRHSWATLKYNGHTDTTLWI